MSTLCEKISLYWTMKTTKTWQNWENYNLKYNSWGELHSSVVSYFKIQIGFLNWQSFRFFPSLNLILLSWYKLLSNDDAMEKILVFTTNGWKVLEACEVHIRWNWFYCTFNKLEIHSNNLVTFHMQFTIVKKKSTLKFEETKLS